MQKILLTLICTFASISSFSSAQEKVVSGNFAYLETQSQTVVAHNHPVYGGSLIEMGNHPNQQCASEFHFAFKGDPNTMRIWLSPSRHFDSSHGLAYEFEPTYCPGSLIPNSNLGYTSCVPSQAGQNTRDKGMHSLFGYGDPKAPVFGEKRYTGFAFYLPENYFDDPFSPVMIWQQWQGSPHTPPVAAFLSTNANNGDIELNISVSNDMTGANPSAIRKETLYSPVKIEKGVWHRFIIMVIPRHSNMSQDGEVRIWKYDDETTNATTQVGRWFGPIGYDPTGTYGGSHPNSSFDVTFGIYRDMQHRFHRIVFDSIRSATTYSAAQVLPTQQLFCNNN